MNKIFFLFFLLVFSSFKYKEQNYCKMVDKITNRYKKEVAVPRGFIITGSGGAMMNDVERVTLWLTSFEAVNVEQARILYVELMEKYLQYINNCEKLRPYLHNFPFDIHNIELNLQFKDSQCHMRTGQDVTFVFMVRRNQLFYKTYNPKMDEFQLLHKETYEEAKRIVEQCATSCSIAH